MPVRPSIDISPGSLQTFWILPLIIKVKASYRHRYRQTETHIDTLTEIHRDTWRQTQKDTQADTQTHIDRHTVTQTHIDTQRYTKHTQSQLLGLSPVFFTLC